MVRLSLVLALLAATAVAVTSQTTSAPVLSAPTVPEDRTCGTDKYGERFHKKTGRDNNDSHDEDAFGGRRPSDERDLTSTGASGTSGMTERIKKCAEICLDYLQCNSFQYSESRKLCKLNLHFDPNGNDKDSNDSDFLFCSQNKGDFAVAFCLGFFFSLPLFLVVFCSLLVPGCCAGKSMYFPHDSDKVNKDWEGSSMNCCKLPYGVVPAIIFSIYVGISVVAFILDFWGYWLGFAIALLLAGLMWVSSVLPFAICCGFGTTKAPEAKKSLVEEVHTPEFTPPPAPLPAEDL